MDKTPEQLVREALEAGQPRSWNFKEDGEMVVGRIVDGFVAPTKYKERCMVVTLLQDDGERVNVWLANDILEKKVLDRRPQMGDTIGIQSLGMKVSGGGNEYQDWNVVVHGGAGKDLPFLASGQVGGEGRALGAGEPKGEQYGSSWDDGTTYGRGTPPESAGEEEAEVIEQPTQAPSGWV